MTSRLEGQVALFSENDHPAYMIEGVANGFLGEIRGSFLAHEKKKKKQKKSVLMQQEGYAFAWFRGFAG